MGVVRQGLCLALRGCWFPVMHSNGETLLVSGLFNVGYRPSQLECLAMLNAFKAVVKHSWHHFGDCIDVVGDSSLVIIFLTSLWKCHTPKLTEIIEEISALI